MEIKTRFKQAAVFCATGRTPEIEKDKFVFKAARKDADDIMTALYKKNVLASDATGVKFTADGEWRYWQEEVSRTWDHNATSITDAKGDWNIVYANREEFVRSGKTIVEFYTSKGEKPLDVQYNENDKKLSIKLWAIDKAPFENTLKGKDGIEQCEKAVFALSHEKAVPALRKSFEQMSKIKALSVEESLDSKTVDDFRAGTQNAIRSMERAIKNSGIGEYLKSEEIKSIVKKITGQSLPLDLS